MNRAVAGQRWPDLDGLRAIAILLVMGRHSLRPFISEDSFQAVAAIGSLDATAFLLNGWSGVDLFFVLSGFLIGRQALQGRDSWRRFWFKRATRILPAYWTSLVIVALTVSSWNGRIGHLLSHIIMLQDYTGSVFVAPFWSLGVEEKFYLLTPVLAILLSRFRRPWEGAMFLVLLWSLPVAARAIGVSGDSLPLAYEQYVPVYRWPFHLTCESLVVGFGIAWLTRDKSFLNLQRRGVRESIFWLGSAVIIWMLAGSLLLRDIGAVTVIGIPAAIGLAFGLLVLACVSGNGSYSRVLGHRFCRPLATGAYTLYLTHMMILPVAVALSRTASWSSGDTLTAQWLNLLPWYAGLSALSAMVLHHLVERPMLIWRDKWLASRAGSEDKQPPVAQCTPSLLSTT